MVGLKKYLQPELGCLKNNLQTRVSKKLKCKHVINAFFQNQLY